MKVMPMDNNRRSNKIFAGLAARMTREVGAKRPIPMGINHHNIMIESEGKVWGPTSI